MSSTPRRAALAASLLFLVAAPAHAQPFKPGPKIGPPPKAAPAADAALQAAIDSPVRPDADRARDKYRHPAATLQFWGLRPGLTVVDLQPGGGYWTRILAPYAKATGGRYFGANGEKSRAGFLSKFGDTAKFGSVGYGVFDKTSGPFAPAGSVDLVITSREIHNWIGGGYLDKAMAQSFAALKPGGVLAVEEHRADPKPEAPGASNGYVTVRTVVDAAQRAGLRFEDASEVNGNPRDTKDHPFGVWTLPPSRQSSAGDTPDPQFDHSKYDAIGESDRMTLRFRKPR